MGGIDDRLCIGGFMINLLSTFTNTNAVAFPDTEAVNSSGGAATDGTEFIAPLVNDGIWGWMQALLDYTGQTPNGITEAPGASQILESLRRFETPGKIIAACWNDDPATLGIRALLLTGQGILRANYTELDALVYVGDGNNPSAAVFYHADDAGGAVRNTAGVYLILPDARGRVVRGLDLTGSVDPDGASRELGDFQGHAFMDHQHISGGFIQNTDANVNVWGYKTSNPAGQETASEFVTGGTEGGEKLTAVSPASEATLAAMTNEIIINDPETDDDESRMINVAANLAITY
jgi:hypothetical protein